MYVRAAFFSLLMLSLLLGAGSAQDRSATTPGNHSAHDMQNMPDMDMKMSMAGPDWMPSPHAGSGTAWQPASVPGYFWMASRKQWDLMAHGVLFLTYNQQGGPRGVGKAESANMLMLMEQHKLWRGTLILRQMFSAESLTSPHPGFPELVQTGET